jgi:flavin reductase (DIM6/NTAB) family NADH-FMN oxidoreductase RutF
LSKVYGLLEPGPVVLLTTIGRRGPNVMTQSWQTMLDFEPPLVACVVSNRNFTFEALRKTKECVINIPTVELAAQVVACGNCSGRDVDKLATIGLTPAAASRVRAPLIAECYANLECRVVDTRAVNRYCLFVLEDRPGAEAPPHHPPPRPRLVHGRRPHHQTALENEIAPPGGRASCFPLVGRRPPVRVARNPVLRAPRQPTPSTADCEPSRRIHSTS